MEDKLREILILHGMCGIENINEAMKEILLLFDVNTPFCHPPNLTYCKQAIYPDFDCEICKWKF